MADSKAELERLRAEVRKAQRAATNKVSRLKVQGIDIWRTAADPRRDPRKAKRYNRKQLQAYLNELNTFRSRETRFERPRANVGADAQWKVYKRLEHRYNVIARREAAKVDQVTLPGQDATLGARMRELRSQVLRTSGERVRFEGIRRRREDLHSDSAIPKLIVDMQRRVNPRYQEVQLANQRANARKLLDQSDGVTRGEKTMMGRLTPYQFNLLWNYTEFPTLISSRYRSQSAGTAVEEALTSEDSSSDIRELLTWAAEQEERKDF